MQSRSSLHSIIFRKNMQESQSQQENICQYDGEYIAKLFKFYRRLQNPYVSHDLPLKLVSGKSLYLKHKEAFDNFAKISSKNRFDVERYIKYCVKCGIREDIVEACISSTTMISKYMNYVSTYDKRKKIYAWFMKSAKNIAKECLSRGMLSTKDFIRELILSHKVGPYVVSGKISMYFFAGIPNFYKVIHKLDYFSKQELEPLEKHFDSYHSDVNKAFLQMKNCMVNPIDFTDRLIMKMVERK